MPSIVHSRLTSGPIFVVLLPNMFMYKLGQYRPYINTDMLLSIMAGAAVHSKLLVSEREFMHQGEIHIFRVTSFLNRYIGHSSLKWNRGLFLPREIYTSSSSDVLCVNRAAGYKSA